ncbi:MULTISPECIES: helix-turn-helix transcriptional regulator [Thermoactinomyces]|uniref:Helix-turn-helix transcriptional regulator n=1 Tax=Thermoactinomyces daqus TaxID=1329516 RepID=A0A7W2AJ01_9BACL|nr:MULTISPECIES: helix-turn-helix transcriptional regulator [Thermoactinomyces]MBA4543433.1 helix-turn-helix transcriptional regulator [Thermoactinomyces daqus]MBH8606027.1 helix-turn-helix transcriptional regulator [Thermoactinomyces sp. CICC 10521]
MKRNWLIKLRLKKGLSRRDVADQAGISRVTYGQYENGIRNPSVAAAQKLGSVLGFDWTIFFTINRCDSHQNDEHLQSTGTEGRS